MQLLMIIVIRVFVGHVYSVPCDVYIMCERYVCVEYGFLVYGESGIAKLFACNVCICGVYCYLFVGDMREICCFCFLIKSQSVDQTKVYRKLIVMFDIK